MELNRVFTKYDIDYALKNMKSYKALGSDGPHAIFFQNYWDTLGSETTNIYLKVVNDDMNMGSINNTSIHIFNSQGKKLEEIKGKSLGLLPSAT